ncbi:MAG: DUF126 domain-containing protein [Pseudomonadota bacterium]
MKQFQGEMLVASTFEANRHVQGQALVLAEPLSLWGGLNPETGEIIDRRHPSSGVVVTDRVLVMPSGRGSSSATSILLEAVAAKTAPCAIILAERDGMLALGAAVAREMYGQTPPVMMVDATTYAQITDEVTVVVQDDGLITIE